MRAKSAIGSIVLLASLASAQPGPDSWAILRLDRAAFRMRSVAVLPQDDEAGVNMVYGDRYGILRVAQIGSGSTREIWRSRTLEGPVMEVLVEDLDGDGRAEIVARTQTARIYVFDSTYNVRWESQSSEYPAIEAMAIANMDEDVSYEIVLLSSGQLNYIDGSTFQREYRSTQSFRASEMAIGNVDTDPQLEIVFNTGMVVDALRGEAEWQGELFGTLIELLDVDGDNVDEILGWSEGQPLRIFDADERQEKPLR
jgi:hypothetical protein